MRTSEEINKIFTYHSPKDDQPERYEKIRAMAKEFAIFVDFNAPDSREKDSFFINLEQAVMWANAGIARRE